MAVKFNTSILYLAKWLKLHDMPNEYLSAFQHMSKKGNLSKGMEKNKWKDIINAPDVPDAADPVQVDVHMDNSEWEKLFKEFRNTFRNMSSDRESIKDVAGAEEYMDLVYGPGRIFNDFKVDAATKTEIDKFISFIKINSIKTEMTHFARTAGIDNLDEFIYSLESQKYNSDNDVRSKLQNMCNHIAYEDMQLQMATPQRRIVNDTAAIAVLDVIGFSQISDGFNTTAETVDAGKLSQFKMYYPELLRSLVSGDDLRKVFSEKGGGKITAPIEKALKQTNYKDENSPDYIAPRVEDKLTPVQELKKRWKEFTDDTVLKLKNRALRDKYLLPDSAKPIAVAIYEAGWHPQDGLDKLLEKSADIEKKFKGKMPVAAESFKFLTEALKYAKTNSPKAFRGALRNGGQGLALDMIIAEYGISSGKSDVVISSAHEVLSKLRWGYTTSKVRKDLWENGMTIFSDSSLSFNKDNEAMQFMTKALDKSLHLMFMAGTELVNLGINAINRRGGMYKENNKRGQQLIKSQNEKIDKRIAKQNDLKTHLNNEMTSLNPRITNQRKIVQDLSDKGRRPGDADFDTAIAELHKMDEEFNGIDSSIDIIDKKIDGMENKEKNRFLSLMATRNMMNGQGGFTKNRNPASLALGSQKNIQERFNANKDRIKNDYIMKYWAGKNVKIAA